MRKLASALVVFLIAAFAATAQSPAQDWNVVKALAPGTMIRITTGPRKATGEVQGVTDDSLTIRSRDGQEMFPRPDIVRLSVRGKSHRLRNTLIGLGVGAGAGAIVGATAARCRGFCVVSAAELTGVAVPVLGGVGAIVGAVIPTRGWRDVYQRRP